MIRSGIIALTMGRQKELSAIVLLVSVILSIFSLRVDIDAAIPLSHVVVEFSGCESVTAGPVCHYRPNQGLTLWTSGPKRPTVYIDGSVIKVQLEPFERGYKIKIIVPAAAKQLEVKFPSGGSWVLPVEPARLPARLQRAEILRRNGNKGEALRIVEPYLSDPDVEISTWALGRAARIHRSQGHLQQAIRNLYGAIEIDRQHGFVSAEYHDRFALTYTLTKQVRDFAAANRALNGLDNIRTHFSVGEAARFYYRGLLFKESGNLAAAIGPLREAERRADRIDLRGLNQDARLAGIGVLQQLGRFEESLIILEKLDMNRIASAPVCPRAQLLNDVAWFRFYAETSLFTAPDLSKARALAERALEAARQCREPRRTAFTLSTLAWILLEMGNVDEADRLNQELGSLVQDYDIRNYATNLRAHVLLKTGRVDEALTLFSTLQNSADLSFRPRLALSSAWGTARCFVALNQLEKANRAYEDARKVLEEQASLIPLGVGRWAFLGHYHQIAAEQLDILLQLARPKQVIEVARLSRTSGLRFLERASRIAQLDTRERRRWNALVSRYQAQRDRRDALASKTTSGRARDVGRYLSELRRAEKERDRLVREALAVLGGQPKTPLTTVHNLPAGTLVIGYHRLPRGWLAFAVMGELTRTARLPELHLDTMDTRQLASELLSPFRKMINDAGRMILLPAGKLSRLSIHALPFDGTKPLLAQMPVSYSLDLTPVPTSAESDEKAVVVLASQPQRKLPMAKQEALYVTEQVRAGGNHADLVYAEKSDREDIEALLTSKNTTYLHYVGHADYSKAEDGSKSGLDIKTNYRLEAQDILMFRRVPRRLFLSGCKTASTWSITSVGLGVATAFLLAGAEDVVAASDDVTDQLAYAFSKQVLARGTFPSNADPSVAVRKAQLELYARQTPGWHKYRVMTRSIR